MIRGIVTVALLALNLAFWATLVIAGGAVKFAVQLTAPRSRLRTRIMRALALLAERWVGVNLRIFDRMLPTEWDVAGVPVDLDREGHYLVISNHQSWTDILVLQRVFHRRAAFIRFFIKQQLIWLPFVGQASWALEFPFMKRYSPEYVAKHPEKRGKDLETTRRAMQRYRHVPVAIGNFIEGTRFTRQKHAEQQSPYRHLLRPRSGGISYVLASLGDQLDAVFDVTIAYPGPMSAWKFVSGGVPVIRVRVRQVDVPAEFLSPAIAERGPARDRFKAWVAELWREKDALMAQLR